MDFPDNQEHGEDLELYYSDIVDNLMDMFAGVLGRDIVQAVVENCGGDLNASAESIVNITSSEGNNCPVQNDGGSSQQYVGVTVENANSGVSPAQVPCVSNTSTLVESTASLSGTPMSYAGISRVPGAHSKKQQTYQQPYIAKWSPEIQKILTYHAKGSRTLILIRGAPGSGKSHLAKEIINMTIGADFSNYKTHICSADDYFNSRGFYQYDRCRLSDAHKWNQDRVCEAQKQGLSPIIIDNTNIEFWEMEPYVRNGVKNGYIVEILEPTTNWAKKANQLVRKNSHNVPLNKIVRMLENFQGSGITGEELIKYFNLTYPPDMTPPLARAIPAVTPFDEHSLESGIPKSDQTSNYIDRVSLPNTESTEKLDLNSQQSSNPFLSGLEFTQSAPNIEKDHQSNTRYLEVEKQLQEIQKIETDWENGEMWYDEKQEESPSTSNRSNNSDPKPPRSANKEQNSEQNLLESVKRCNDWSQISLFLPPWHDEKRPHLEADFDVPVETCASGTCMELGDRDVENPRTILKVLSAMPRDINLFHLPLNIDKVPKERKLDKSTMTEEIEVTQETCKNREHHFRMVRKLFPHLAKASLRDVFDNCIGDPNWTVSLLMANESNQANVENNIASDNESESEIQEMCNCSSGCNVGPDTRTIEILPEHFNSQTPEASISIVTVKKIKTPISENSVNLKRQIEKNVVIPDQFYPDHSLKIMKHRRGENASPTSITSIKEAIEAPVFVQANTPTETGNTPSASKRLNSCSNDSDVESCTDSLDETETIVNVNLGMGFIKQLDDIFGRNDMKYPDNVVPKINIPMHLLNEINAFWMESLMYQLDQSDQRNSRMMKEDEEFARQLAKKEQELALEGKEPEVPDFKEIMDMDLAMSLYEKDVAEWRNKEPTDLAAKMSRDKLYNLFPDVPQDTLSELLMAHDNNFKATVEVLLMSTGKTDILEATNGVNKFIVKMEMQRKEKILEEEKAALYDAEWPLLPGSETFDMSTVNELREEAERHLDKRNHCYQKAQESIRRGMTQVANYYSELAAFHKLKYEQISSKAAATLIQVNSQSQDNATIDLHYLRVSEARESLDIFLDSHIQKLRESEHKVSKNTRTLYFITGRGKHSQGGPRVKPAVKKRLEARGLVCFEGNPGLLYATVSSQDKLSYQVPSPVT